jgi:hypothetical protein
MPTKYWGSKNIPFSDKPREQIVLTSSREDTNITTPDLIWEEEKKYNIHALFCLSNI